MSAELPSLDAAPIPPSASTPVGDVVTQHEDRPRLCTVRVGPSHSTGKALVVPVCAKPRPCPDHEPPPYSSPVASPPVGRVVDEPRACICIADARGCLEKAQVNDVLCRSCRLYHERPFGPNAKHPAPSLSDDPAPTPEVPRG